MVLKITEPQPQFGRMIVADYLPAGFEIDNPRLVSSGETGTLAWIEDAQEPVHSEFRDDRFSAAFERKAGDPAVFTVAYVVRAVSPGRYVHAAGLCRGHVPARPLRPHRDRRDRGDGGEVSDAMTRRRRAHATTTGCARLARGRIEPRLLAALARSGRRVDRLARAGAARRGARVLDRWCSIARAGCCGPTPRRRAAGGCRPRASDVDPRFLELLLAYEDKRFRRASPASIRWRSARAALAAGCATAASSPAARPSPCRWRGCSSRAPSARSPPSCARWCARSRSSARSSKDEILALYLSLAPYGGNLEGVRAASLAYFGKEPRRLTLGEAALLVALPQSPEAAPAGPLDRMRRATRATACSTASPRPGVVPADEVARAKHEPVPDGRKPMPMLAPHAAEPAVAAAPERSLHRLTIDATLQRNLEELARERARALGSRHLGCDPRGRSCDRRGAGARRLGRLFRRAAAPARST